MIIRIAQTNNSIFGLFLVKTLIPTPIKIGITRKAIITMIFISQVIEDNMILKAPTQQIQGQLIRVLAYPNLL